MNAGGTAPLALQLPPGLAQADPDALRRRASEHRADATATGEQARALRAAVVRLVPAAWHGLGALSFAAGALLQVAGLEQVASASSDLAAALLDLAAGIEQAQAEAVAAVRAGQQFDDETAVEEQRWLSRPEPERLDPDPARLPARLDVASRLRTALAAAEEQAPAAWARATAAFDFVAYRMPSLAARMSGDGSSHVGPAPAWRPADGLRPLPVDEWRHLAGLSPVCITGGYAGAGGLLGPDGRRYPLVVPWVADAGGAGSGVPESGVPDSGVHGSGVRWTADLGATASRTTDTLDGADPGWHRLGVRVGADVFTPPVSTATKAAIVTAGIAGNAPQLIGRLRPDLLPALRWSSSGAASVAPVGAIPVPRAGGTGQIPRSSLSRAGDDLRWDPEAEVPAPVTPTGPNVLALTEGGLEGLGTARRMDAATTSAYRATFEENDDGRIRARLTTYQVEDGQDGPSVLANDVSVTPDGRLHQDPVRYRLAADGITSGRG